MAGGVRGGGTWQGACVAGGVHGGGRAWQGDDTTRLRDTVGQCAGGTHPTGMHSCS